MNLYDKVFPPKVIVLPNEKKRDEAPLPRPAGRRCAFGAHGALC